MTDSDPRFLPPTLGLLLWRHHPAGREVCTLRVEDRLVLPKGVLQAQEDEPEAVTRLARELCDAKVEDLARVESSDGPAVSWWRARWAGPCSDELEGRRTHLGWLDERDAAVQLSRLPERELARRIPLGAWGQLREVIARPRRAQAQRAAWRLADDLQRLEALPEEARLRARALLQRATDAEALGDRSGARTAREDLLALEVAARPAAADALRAAARAASDRAEEEVHRGDRAQLAAFLAAALVAVLLLGHPGWWAAEGPAPADQHVAIALLGLIGGAVSAMTRPSRFPCLGRPVLGSLAATLAQALLSGTTLASFSPAGWLLVAYAAGFAERLVTRPSARRDPARG